MRKVLIALWLQALMAACAPIGVSTPLTFDERLADDIAAVSQIRTTTTALLREGKISSDDAQHVRAEADKARSDLDVARALHETDTNGGNAQLARGLDDGGELAFMHGHGVDDGGEFVQLLVVDLSAHFLG